MESYHVYWGDFHKHLEEVDRAETIMTSARGNLDFYAVLEYPFYWYKVAAGLKVESVRNRPRFLEMWETLRELAIRHNVPGEFVTFLGYEWNGNRTRWGDHNIIYFDPAEGELLDTWDLPDLLAQLRGRKVFAIPHHTGYTVGWRGKDWGTWDPQLSPVMEIYSAHGSSEGCVTPVPMLANEDMGPRFPGGTFQDALERDIRIGVIGSNDGGGLPGSWESGVAAVLARENTREALWEAIRARRTYASTGDRILLDFSVNGVAMGGELVAKGRCEARVRVECCQTLDRVELIHNNRVVRTHCHQETLPSADRPVRVKVLIECGWGPAAYFGWPEEEMTFAGSVGVRNGLIEKVAPRLRYIGQELTREGGQCCRWTFTTPARTMRKQRNWQGLILTVRDTGGAVLEIEVNGRKVTAPVAELLRQGICVNFINEAKARIEAHFGVRPDELENPDVYYHHAQKVKIHRAAPDAAFGADVTFSDLELAPGVNSFYTRVSQVDGQTAWSSPVWVVGE